MGRETPKQQEQQHQVSYTVEELVAVNPYNPDILPDLENHVNEQVSSQTYSLDANLCLLRLYQFEPERMSIQIVVRILIKALMALPAPDFNLCLFLIPERVQMEEQIKTLTVLSHYLETARFRQFWDEAAKYRSILEVVPGFEQAIQAYAIHVLSLTYQKVPRPVIAEKLLAWILKSNTSSWSNSLQNSKVSHTSMCVTGMITPPDQYSFSLSFGNQHRRFIARQVSGLPRRQQWLGSGEGPWPAPAHRPTEQRVQPT